MISTEEMRRLEKAGGSIKAAQELELLEQCEKTIRDLSEMETLRPLTTNEARELSDARNSIDKIREMVAVPDESIQVDVFTSNPSTGEFGKSHFYTKAVAPEDPADAPKVAANQVPPFAPYALEHMATENRP